MKDMNPLLIKLCPLQQFALPYYIGAEIEKS